MTMPITLTSAVKDRRQMILQALEAKAPKTYQSLKKSGQLAKFANQAEKSLMEDYEIAASQALTRARTNVPANETAMEAVKKVEMGLYEAWNQTIQNHLEFSDETTE